MRRYIVSARHGSEEVKVGSVIDTTIPEQALRLADIAAMLGGWSPSADFDALGDQIIDGALAKGEDELAVSQVVFNQFIRNNGFAAADGYLLTSAQIAGVLFDPGFFVVAGDPTGLGASLVASGAIFIAASAVDTTWLAAMKARIATLRARGARRADIDMAASAMFLGSPAVYGSWPTPGTPGVPMLLLNTTFTADGVLREGGSTFDDTSTSTPISLAALSAAGGVVVNADVGFDSGTNGLVAYLAQIRLQGVDARSLDAIVINYAAWWDV